MVPCISLATQHSKIFGKSVSRVAFGQLKKRRYHKAVVTRRWFVKKHASTYAQCRARLADGKSMLFVNEQHDVTLLGWLQSFFRSHPSRPDFPGLSPHTFFEKGVFMLKVAHTLDVRSFHAAELALPGVERGAADTVLTIYVLGSPVRFARLQDWIWCSENRDFFMAPSWGWFTRSLQFWSVLF